MASNFVKACQGPLARAIEAMKLQAAKKIQNNLQQRTQRFASEFEARIAGPPRVHGVSVGMRRATVPQQKQTPNPVPLNMAWQLPPANYEFKVRTWEMDGQKKYPNLTKLFPSYPRQKY